MTTSDMVRLEVAQKTNCRGLCVTDTARVLAIRLSLSSSRFSFMHSLCRLSSICFGIEVPSAGSRYNKAVQVNMPLCVPFLLIGMIKILKF